MTLGMPSRPPSMLLSGFANCEVIVGIPAATGGASIDATVTEGATIWPAAIRPLTADQAQRYGADLTQKLYECFIPEGSGVVDYARIRVVSPVVSYRVDGGSIAEGGESGVLRCVLKVET